MSIANLYDKNIFCLEGDWKTNLRKKSSVQNALQLLEAIERNMLKNYKELCAALDFKIYYCC